MLLRTATPVQARDIATASARLIDEAQMGTLFKALALVARDMPAPPGFDPTPNPI